MAKIDRRVASVLVLIVVIVLGLVAVAIVLKPNPTPVIGVIQVKGPMISGDVRDNIVRMITYAGTNSVIRGVVLDIDSPGGSVQIAQDIFGNILALKKQKPVVASIIRLGASGAYYIALAADEIYALPASLVGNIGLIAYPPTPAGPFQDVTETGPYKLSGLSEKQFLSEVQLLQHDFLDLVQKMRGARLKAPLTELSKGAVYLGAEAVQMGLIDKVGSSNDALVGVAEIAHLTRYKIQRINDLFPASPSLILLGGLNNPESADLSLEDLGRLTTPPAFYYIFLPRFHSQPSLIVKQSNVTRTSTTPGTARVIVDFAHANQFNKDDLNILHAQLVSDGANMVFMDNSTYLKSLLGNATSLVIINPEQAFSSEDAGTIADFIGRGGKLLLIDDPERVSPGSAHMEVMNSLSGQYGVVFGDGYLYNLRSNEYNYRNIIVTHFANNPLTKDLKKIVFYTATQIYSRGGALAITDNDTQWSGSEISKAYSPMVYVKNMHVLAVGSLTFLEEPYSYTADNYKLLTNIASFLASR